MLASGGNTVHVQGNGRRQRRCGKVIQITFRPARLRCAAGRKFQGLAVSLVRSDVATGRSNTCRAFVRASCLVRVGVEMLLPLGCPQHAVKTSRHPLENLLNGDLITTTQRDSMRENELSTEMC